MKSSGHQSPHAAGQLWTVRKARVISWYAERSPVWRFGLKFGALMALFYILVLTPFCDRLFYSYLAANAWLASGILNLLGENSHVSEITIRSARFAITVRRGCDAIEPAWFYCAALLSFPAPLARKIAGLLAGAALLQVLNLVRIVSLYFIGLHYPRAFNPAHLEIWPAVFVLVAISLWVGWIGWTRRPARSASHAVP
jgi:exosortase/archaeosortase family protein